ncbi:hypothetical protein JRO89_XS11G0050200 [Xanthoceras sorbifolium]|uniref:Glycosyltransferase n=1 Tax=Xanthoceras sorbifolium TaxID=99658 RepID=A0ABQ8HER8_9ROSI|nr:hypothetical protein JRO89_XS11G0050200 [Xanthoceras sorbifolium]
MDTKANAYHVVALPLPSPGHINPMMNLSKNLATRNHNILVTFVVTEECLGFFGSHICHPSITFATIPKNIIPSQNGDVVAFFRAINTKMEAPFEQILDQLDLPVTIIVTDAILCWAIDTANRKNIPVAALWTTSTLLFSFSCHFDLFTEKKITIDLEDHGDDIVDFIPEISSIRIADLPLVFMKNDQKSSVHVLPFKLEVSKLQYLLSSSIYEVEPQAFDILKAKFNIPIYHIGPLIPFSSTCQQDLDYIEWLNSQPANSVLYISMGSIHSVSSAQMDEMVAGLKSSGVRYLWVARDDSSRLKDCCGDHGLMVPWCDQLGVFRHPAVGGFLTHCGFNSIMEAAFAGVPMLTFPLYWDQFPNSKLIVEDWQIGWRLKKEVGAEKIVTREAIVKTIQTFMDMNNNMRNELIKRAKQVQEILQAAIASGGSSDTDLNAFIKDITQGNDL